jgi:hypothetical protein
LPFVIHRPLERAQIGTAKRMFAEIIASHVRWWTFNHALEAVIPEESQGKAKSEGPCANWTATTGRW